MNVPSRTDPSSHCNIAPAVSPGSLVLILPGFTDVALQPVLDRYPGLQRLQRLASANISPILCFEQAVLWALGYPVTRAESVPAAAVTYNQDFHESPLHCVRADPVSLRAGQDNAVLVPSSALELTAAETDALLDSLNQLVRQDGLQFIAGEQDRWYLTGHDGATLESLPPALVAGRNAGAFLPDGSDAAWWKRLQTECQMLLHNHEINAERLRRQRPSVNSLWFWGGHPLASVNNVLIQRIYADDAFSRGLAQLTPASPRPLREWIGRFDPSGETDTAVGTGTVGGAVVATDDLLDSVVMQQPELAVECLSRLEAPIARSLRELLRGECKLIHILPCDGQHYTIRRRDLIKPAYWLPQRMRQRPPKATAPAAVVSD